MIILEKQKYYLFILNYQLFINDNNLRKQTLDINFDYNSFNFWFHRQNGYEIVSNEI